MSQNRLVVHTINAQENTHAVKDEDNKVLETSEIEEIEGSKSTLDQTKKEMLNYKIKEKDEL